MVRIRLRRVGLKGQPSYRIVAAHKEAPRDGRAVFIMPWRDGQTLVGTTERNYQGDPAAIAPTSTEIDYLLATVRHYFPAYARIEPSAAFAGLRVLPRADSAAFGRARDTRLHSTHRQRVVSITRPTPCSTGRCAGPGSCRAVAAP